MIPEAVVIYTRHHAMLVNKIETKCEERFELVQYWLVQQLAKWCKQGTMIAFQNTSYYRQFPLNRMCTKCHVIQLEEEIA